MHLHLFVSSVLEKRTTLQGWHTNVSYKYLIFSPSSSHTSLSKLKSRWGEALTGVMDTGVTYTHSCNPIQGSECCLSLRPPALTSIILWFTFLAVESSCVLMWAFLMLQWCSPPLGSLSQLFPSQLLCTSKAAPGLPNATAWLFCGG